MLIYEKDNKLNINFQTGNVPQPSSDVTISKEGDKVTLMLGETEVQDSE